MYLAAQFHLEIRDPRPLSINEIYSTGKGGVRFLTTPGKKFKSVLATRVADATSGASARLQFAEADYCITTWKDVIDVVYRWGGHVQLFIELHTRVLNESWQRGGSVTKKNVARSPYQRMDATNYVKLIEDAVVRGTGIDDSAHIETLVRKVHNNTDPHIKISYRVWGRDHEDN